MKTNQIKLLVIAAFAFSVFAFLFFQSSVVQVKAVDDETVAYYKKTCVMCHAATATKAFDPAKEDAVLVEIILNGKKAEKPPHMPEYKSKGVTEEKAKALVAHMKQLRAEAK